MEATLPKDAADAVVLLNNTGGLATLAGLAESGSIGNDALTVQVTSLVGASATRYGFIAPFKMTITKIQAILLGHALTTGDATLTGKIADTGITGGVVTITQAGSAIGDKHSASPSALNVAQAGDFVELLVGGTNDNTSAFAVATINFNR